MSKELQAVLNTHYESERHDKERKAAKELYDMKMHEMIGRGWEITRVPGGWIYSQGNGAASLFVPYDNEFAPSGDKP